MQDIAFDAWNVDFCEGCQVMQIIQQIDDLSTFVGNAVDFEQMKCEDLKLLAINANGNDVEDSVVENILKCKADIHQLWIHGADYEFLLRIKEMADYLTHLYLDMTEGTLRIAQIGSVRKMFNIDTLFSVIVIDAKRFNEALDNLYVNDDIKEIHIVSKPRDHVIINNGCINSGKKTVTTTNYSILERSREFDVVQLILQPEDTHSQNIEKTLIANQRKFGVIVIKAAHYNQLSFLSNPKISWVKVNMSDSWDTINKTGEHISLYAKLNDISNKIAKATRSLAVCCGMELEKDRKVLAGTIKKIPLECLEIAMKNDCDRNNQSFATSFLLEFLDGITSKDLKELTTLKLDMTTINVEENFSRVVTVFNLPKLKYLIIELINDKHYPRLASWFKYRDLYGWNAEISENRKTIIYTKVHS